MAQNITIAGVSYSGVPSVAFMNTNGDIVVYNDIYEVNGIVKCNGAGQASRAVPGTDYAAASSIFTATLAASSWVGTAAPYTYTLSVSGVTPTSNQEVLPALTITQEQLEALQGANIVDGGQASGSITLKAWGDKPSVDIPIRVIKRGDM